MYIICGLGNRSHVRYATCEENKNQYRIYDDDAYTFNVNRLFGEKETDDIIYTDIHIYI